jgi:hypothetical protein
VRGVLAGIVLCAPALFAAVDGIVFNGTTNQPQPSAQISLIQPGAQGMQTLGSAQTDAQGKFRFDRDVPPGPALLQATHQGTTYTLIVTPGTPTTGLRVTVYDSTTRASVAQVGLHFIMLERTDTDMQVVETFQFQNDLNETYQDPSKGSIRVFLPQGAPTAVQANVTAPGGGGISVRRPLEKTNEPGVYKVDYPIKPGETTFEITYSMPPSESFSGRWLHSDAPMRLITPGTVTLTGDGIKFLAQEPQTQARIYEVTKPSFDVKVEGTGAIPGVPSPDSGGAEEESGAPKLEQAPARVYSRLGLVLAVSLAILALGGALLYRKGTA